MYKVYPYKMVSASGKALARSLGVKRVRPDGRYRYRRGHTIINWGNSTMPNWISQEAVENMLNKPVNVSMASNKLKTLQWLQVSGVPCLEFTRDWSEAQEWDTVYLRHTLSGHSGQGVEVWHPSDGQIPYAPLYTKGLVNCGEYRVHVFKDEVIDYRKRSRADGDEATVEQSQVRTNGNGWIFRQGNLRRLERIEELARNAIKALGLDFGAVDIIMDETGVVRVCEINSAPAMETRTLEAYTNKFIEYESKRRGNS